MLHERGYVRERDERVQRARAVRCGDQGGQDMLRVRVQRDDGREGQEGALGGQRVRAAGRQWVRRPRSVLFRQSVSDADARMENRPFVLLAGTTLTLFLLVGGSIALLSGVGEENLPSTLTGGVAPHAR